MKVKLWNEEETNKTLNLRLVYGYLKNKMYLAVVDDDGTVACGGYLLGITEDGKFFRCPGVNVTLGLQLDESGRLVVK